MLLREQRQAEAAQAETVIPKVALRQNEADDPFAKYLGENAAAIRRGRGQRIERISQDDPLPGEPKVTPGDARGTGRTTFRISCPGARRSGSRRKS